LKSSHKTETDSFYMQRCEALANQAEAKGNSPVGAIIILKQKIISEAEEAAKTKNDITCHAEIEAIRLAIKNLNTNDLSDCVMYTTHEPCIMCAYVTRYYKIKKVVYKNTVNYLGGISSSLPLLTTSDVPPHWTYAPEIVHLNP
jgi:Cytosine/adenosine deaminases